MNKYYYVVIKKDACGEYRVPAPDCTEKGAYYTDDKQDAEGTARMMHGKDVEIKHRTIQDYHNG